MAFVAVPNGVKVEMLATIYGRPMVNVLGGIVVAQPDQVALQTAAEAWADAWQTELVGFAEDPYVFKGCRMTELDAVDGLQAFAPHDDNGAGGSDKNMPPSISAVVSLHTAERSRSGRGRFYWPVIRQAGVVEAQTFQLSESMRTGLSSVTSAFNLAITGGDVTWAVISRRDAIARQVVNFSIDSRVDHQRRRDGKGF